MIGKQIPILFAIFLAVRATGSVQTQGQCKPRASRCTVNEDCCSETCRPLEGSPYKFCNDVVNIRHDLAVTSSGQLPSSDSGECSSVQGAVTLTQATFTGALSTE